MTRRSIVLVLAVVMMLSLCMQAAVFASERDVRGNDSLQDVLRKHEGKTVEIVLSSGEKISGKLSDAGRSMIVIERIQGREFYDAYIRLSDISAVIVRAREK